MIYVVGGGSGGSADVFAFIIATYPSGSTCTASNGTKTLTASDTSGSYVFQIPTPSATPETWTVSCTDGVETASTTVSISTKGQSTSIELSYFPEGYTKLNYIQTSGTQALKLEFTQMDVFGCKIEADITVLEISGNQSNLLAYGGGTYRVYYLYAYSSNLYGIATTNGAGDGNNINSLVNTSLHYVYDINTSTRAFTVTINGNQTNSGTRNAQNSTFFNVFSENNRWYGKVRCENIKIYSPTDHSVLLFDLAPAMRNSDSVVGMINLVDETFYTNVGTGTFAYG